MHVRALAASSAPDLIGILILGLALTFLVARLAAAKGYSYWTFFLLSFFVSPLLAGFYLRFLPRRAPARRRPRTRRSASPDSTPLGHPGAATFDGLAQTAGWRARDAGAEAPDFEALGRELGLPLPEDYRPFLATSGGFEGRFGATRLILHGVDRLTVVHRESRAAEFFPGLIILGSDGAGSLFAFDSTIDRYVVVPNMGSPKEGVPLGATAAEFLERVHEGRLGRE